MGIFGKESLVDWPNPLTAGHLTFGRFSAYPLNLPQAFLKLVALILANVGDTSFPNFSKP